MTANSTIKSAFMKLAKDMCKGQISELEWEELTNEN
jgi:hypothetical protein